MSLDRMSYRTERYCKGMLALSICNVQISWLIYTRDVLWCFLVSGRSLAYSSMIYIICFYSWMHYYCRKDIPYFLGLFCMYHYMSWHTHTYFMRYGIVFEVPSWTQQSTSPQTWSLDPNGTGQASSRSIICDAGKVPEVAGGLTGVFAHGMLEYIYIYHQTHCSICSMMFLMCHDDPLFFNIFFEIMCHVSKCSRNAPGAY